MGEIKMRGIVIISALLAVGLSLTSQVSFAESFLKKCFPDIDFSKSKVECVLNQNSGELKFTLKAGAQLNTTGATRFGDINKNFTIERISHLQPRLTSAGPMDESLRFIGKSMMGSFTATMNFACNQTAFAFVGFDKTLDDNELPQDHAARCHIESLK